MFSRFLRRLRRASWIAAALIVRAFADVAAARVEPHLPSMPASMLPLVWLGLQGAGRSWRRRAAAASTRWPSTATSAPLSSRTRSPPAQVGCLALLHLTRLFLICACAVVLQDLLRQRTYPAGSWPCVLCWRPHPTLARCCRCPGRSRPRTSNSGVLDLDPGSGLEEGTGRRPVVLLRATMLRSRRSEPPRYAYVSCVACSEIVPAGWHLNAVVFAVVCSPVARCRRCGSC